MTNNNGDHPAPAPAPTGLRAQLHHLLPRHALFQVRITIHQLASVPLVNGEFGVKWKFKNTHKVKGKAKAPEPENDGDGDSFGSADTSIEEPQMLSAPSSNTHSTGTSTTSMLDDPQAPSTSARSGQTPWLPLREHAVTWDQSLSAVVQMSIERDTHTLLPHPFKLTVLQRVIANDPDAPHNPRLGVVDLDLAEYADSVPLSAAPKGIVTRRYLLSDSKTNATLRLSIRVEPVGASTSFIAPPLPNGEILAGVATLLSSQDDVYRTRPRALDLYAPVEKLVSSKSSIMSSKSKETTPFDIRALPRAYGPRPTESLIQALFNPAPVRDERLVSPFTRLVTADSGSVPSFPSSTSFTSSSSSRPSTSASSHSLGLTPSAENASPAMNRRVSEAVSSTVHGSLRPGHRHTSSFSPSVSPSISPSVGSSTRGSATDASTPHHWWKRNRSRSRSRAPTPVSVA
ncbi:N-terminal C2 in EEIG1 and EHBP1 proteins-domain-containing protein [Mycena alexandri]|uniref:N-terminal C2 in EEIG1 and EHBP1 proteins-domain-containing protein n=1 Tax=Mycena alexandri TaxID=1745969 RepID=A0AAD6S9M4_9AGAR|nr:N-terminal C2 in EEIG1 and EHBP1 proteins-domain-containing protein [Mycena alexandri]